MTSADFPGATLKIGKGQEDTYHTIHALPVEGPQGEILAIYNLTDEEVEQIVRDKKLYYSRWTFGEKFQPMQISAQPIMINIRLDFEAGSVETAGYVTAYGIQVEGYERLADGSYKKKEPNVNI